MPQDVHVPAELIQVLRHAGGGGILEATAIGPILFVMAPAEDIESMRGRVRIRVTHALYATEHGPAIQIVTRVFDRTEAPFVVETFINPADRAQWAVYDAVTRSPTYAVVFLGRDGRQALAKRVTNTGRAGLREIVHAARDRLRASAPDALDFDRVKATIQALTPGLIAS
jgi:hypothetical protein